jgi:hypothetical protein
MATLAAGTGTFGYLCGRWRSFPQALRSGWAFVGACQAGGARDAVTISRERCRPCVPNAARLERGDVLWYREHHNHERPHSALGYRTPAEYAAACVPSGSAALRLQVRTREGVLVTLS